MKFGQLIEYNRNIFLQNLCRNWGRETSSRPLLFFLKSFIWGESKWSAASFQYISIAHNLAYNKNNMYKILDYWLRDILTFNSLEKVLGIVSITHFVYDFQEKCFSCYSLLVDQISWSNCLYFLRYWAICVLQLFVSQVMTP